MAFLIVLWKMISSPVLDNILLLTAVSCNTSTWHVNGIENANRGLSVTFPLLGPHSIGMRCILVL